MSVEALTAAALAARPLPRPPEDEDKIARGTVLVAAGGPATPGAPILTGQAALRVGAGRLQLAASAAVANALGLAVPEAGVVLLPVSATGEFAAAAGPDLSRALAAGDALVLGPGVGDVTAAAALLEHALVDHAAIGVVADAAALPAVRDGARLAPLAAGRLVLTPHAGEMARMMEMNKDEVAADPVGLARRAAADLDAVVVLKGATTFIAAPGGPVWRHDGGVVGLATSGSGDVLAGIIGGLLARGAAAETAALWGVHLHASAGARLTERFGPVGFLASDLLPVLPTLLPR